ncbi:hypothetical protein C8Q77DRAFT_1046134 [Trametes polyzona]|nr:hypothetical protein C8Q77DRAFT_1046134 [Trametes polyzona]
MRTSVLTSLVLFLASSAVNAAVLGSSTTPTCENEVVVSETFIGEDKNVKVTQSHCDETPFVTAQGTVVSSLTKRQADPTNVCGAQCNTFCFNGAGGGPNEDDCAVIANALLFDSQNGKPLFNATAAGTPTNKVTMQFHSCTTYFLNQAATDLTYCRSDWSTLVTWLAGDCNAAHNAHGGLCVAADQRWYIQ